MTTQLRLLPSPDVMRLVQGRPAPLSAEQLIGEIEWPDTAEAQEVKEGDEHSVAEEAGFPHLLYMSQAQPFSRCTWATSSPPRRRRCASHGRRRGRRRQ